MNQPVTNRFLEPRFQQFHAWRESLSGASPMRQRFEEWVFLNGAAVLLAEKTGELLTLSYEEFPMEAAAVEARLDQLSDAWGFARKASFGRRLGGWSH